MLILALSLFLQSAQADELPPLSTPPQVQQSEAPADPTTTNSATSTATSTSTNTPVEPVLSSQDQHCPDSASTDELGVHCLHYKDDNIDMWRVSKKDSRPSQEKAFTFSSNGEMACVAQWKNSGQKASHNIGVQSYLIWPIRSEIKSEVKENHMNLSLASGETAQFSLAQSQWTNTKFDKINGCEMKLNDVTTSCPGKTPNCGCGWQVSSCMNSVVIDLGFRMGGSNKENKAAPVEIRDGTGGICRLTVGDIWTYPDLSKDPSYAKIKDPARLAKLASYKGKIRYNTAEAQFKFLREKCPMLDLHDAFPSYYMPKLGGPKGSTK